MWLLISMYFLLNILACVLGFKEGILYSRKGAEAFRWDEHLVFLIERSLIAILLILFCFLNLEEAVVLIILWVFSFSYWHNGCYFVSREYIDVPKYHFTGESDTSSAVLELNFWQRASLKIISIIGLIIYIIYFI